MNGLVNSLPGCQGESEIRDAQESEKVYEGTALSMHDVEALTDERFDGFA